MMRYILIALIIVGCNWEPGMKEVLEENIRLRKEVDSLKNELNKCDMLIESYEGMPLNI